MSPAATTAGPRLTDDARLELAMAAAARERSSRPRALVLLGALLLAVALGAAMLGVSARASAVADARRAQAASAEAQTLLAEFERLRARQSQSDPNLGKRIPDLVSRMEALASRAGIAQKVPPPRESTPRPIAGITVREYAYSGVVDPQLKALLEWVTLAKAEFPGLEVFAMTLKPDPNNWTMSVTFRRWERTGG